MLAHDIERATRRDHGVSADAAGARWWRASTTPRGRSYPGVGPYVAACWRLGAAGVDGRLLAVGWRVLPPRAMVDIAERWLAYWARAVERPTVVGSPYNAPVADVWRAFRAGLPAWIARWWIPVSCGRLGRCMSDAAIDRAAYCARALRRSRRLRGNASERLLAALGRLCPELQRVAVSTLPELPPTVPGMPRRLWRSSDVQWEIVSYAQRAMLARTEVRIRIARGERRNRLVRAAVEACVVPF